MNGGTNLCHCKLKFELGSCTALSVRNGFLITGVVAGVFRNRVQLVPPIVILNASGSPVPAPTNWVEVPCCDIVAAAGAPMGQMPQPRRTDASSEVQLQAKKRPNRLLRKF